MGMPRLSIVVVNFNRRQRLRHCLSSIPSAIPNYPFELFVVDNGSGDGSVAMVQEQFPQAIVMQQNTNQGFSRAVNRALKQATGNYFLCLNNDAWLAPGSLDRLLSFMEAHPDIGIVGGKILNADGSLQLSARSFPTFATALFNRASLLTRFFPQNRFSRRYLLSDWDHARPQEVDWVSGSFLAIRRAACEAIGFLDERFFLFCEDVDWCLRAKQAGWKVVYFPEAVGIHYMDRRPNPFRAVVAHHQSMFRFYRKHLRRTPLWDPIVGAAVGARALVALSILLFSVARRNDKVSHFS